ncbi:MAG: hypothetical protein A2W26_06565 [Acidobacteria bacterium RBG_16_64_8]|nr:MAG: hypothetical protein A2W26_06565 [Acidobacteria bacterium RBG_16_64_8]
MNKQQIFAEIRRLTAANDGKPPGRQRFHSETGLRMSDWYPRLWLRWGDAIREAGLQPNALSAAFTGEHLIEQYIALIRELGRFPIEGDLVRRRERDKTFPNRGAFNGLGSKPDRANAIREYCEAARPPDWERLVQICAAVQSSRPGLAREATPGRAPGYVYLVQHGSRREFKIGRTAQPVRREGEIRLQLPEKLRPIHSIKTDDPAGVESYWHGRFASKRKEGEWFALSSEDVRAFKRWKRIY